MLPLKKSFPQFNFSLPSNKFNPQLNPAKSMTSSPNLLEKSASKLMKSSPSSNTFTGTKYSSTYTQNTLNGKHYSDNIKNTLNSQNKTETLLDTLKTEAKSSDLDLKLNTSVLSYSKAIEETRSLQETLALTETTYKRNLISHTGAKRSAVPHGIMRDTSKDKAKINGIGVKQDTDGIQGEMTAFKKRGGLRTLQELQKQGVVI